MATNMTSKGQVTVPKSVRDYLGLKPGVKVTFERLPNGDVVLRPIKRSAKSRPSVFEKIRGRADIKMTTDEIMALMRGPIE